MRIDTGKLILSCATGLTGFVLAAASVAARAKRNPARAARSVWHVVNHAPRGSVRFYHETPEKNLQSILTEGLRSKGYTAGWPTLTDWLGGALEYSRDDSIVLEVSIPKSKLKEFIWPHPLYSEHYGNQYAIRKPLPAEFIRAWCRREDLQSDSIPARPTEAKRSLGRG